MSQIFSKTLLGNSIKIFSIRFMSLLANLFGIIYYSHTLPVEEHGLYTFFLTSLAIAVSLGSLGMGATLFNFSSEGFIKFYKNIGLKKWSVYVIYLIIVTLGLAWVIHFQFPNKIDTYATIIISIFFILSIFNFLKENVLLLFDKKKQQLITNLITSSFIIWVHYAAVKDSHLDFLKLVTMWGIVLLIKNIIQWILLHQSMKIPANPLGEIIELQPSKKTWWQLGFYEVFQSIIKQADKFIVGLIASKEASAIYFNGRIDIPFLPAILSSVRNASLIKLSKQQKNTDSIIQITHQTFSILSSICISVVVFGTFYSEELLSIAFSEKYLLAKDIFIWSLLILPAQYCISLTYLLQYQEKANIINKGAFIDLILSLILLYPFYQWWGISGIAIAVCISTYIQSIYYAWNAGNTLQVSSWSFFPWKDYGWKIVSTIIIVLISKWILDQYLSINWRFIIGGIMGLFWVMYLLKKDLKKQITM